MTRSGLVATILEEYFTGAQAADTEVEDLKKQLADKEAESSALQAQVKEHTDQDTAIKGLQQQLDTARTQIKTLEDKLTLFTRLNNDLKADKENLQEQLELVTLRLPAPRVGFWARLVGGEKPK